MDEIERMEAELRKEKAKYEVNRAMQEREEKKKILNKQLKDYKLKNNKTFTSVKKLGVGFDKFLGGIETNSQKQKSGVSEDERKSVV